MGLSDESSEFSAPAMAATTQANVSFTRFFVCLLHAPDFIHCFFVVLSESLVLIPMHCACVVCFY